MPVIAGLNKTSLWVPKKATYDFGKRNSHEGFREKNPG